MHGFHGFDFNFKNRMYPFQNPNVIFHTFYNNKCSNDEQNCKIPQLEKFKTINGSYPTRS